MAGLGLGVVQTQDLRPPAPPPVPEPGPVAGSLDGQPVYETENGIAFAPSPQAPGQNAPKPKPKGGANSIIEQLRRQAVAQMAAIQQQLKEAEEAALAEKAAGQMDVDTGPTAQKEADIGNLEDWSDGVDDYEEDSEYEFAIKVTKSKKGHKGAAGVMGAMQRAAEAMGLEHSDELDEADTTREANRENDRQVLEHANNAYREDLAMEQEMQDASDIEEYEADLMSEDEEEEDPGAAMAREAQRLLEERVRQAPLPPIAPAFGPNIDPSLQMPDVPQQGAFYNVVPPAFRPEEDRSEGTSFDPDNPDKWGSDLGVDSDGVPHRNGRDEDGDVAMGEDGKEDENEDDYEEYDSE